MGSERLSSSSRRMRIGRLESGSSASPCTFISTNMAASLLGLSASVATQAVRQRLGDADGHDVADGDHARPDRSSRRGCSACGPCSLAGVLPGRPVHQHLHRAAHQAAGSAPAPTRAATSSIRVLRSALTASGTWSGMAAAGVPGRRE